MFSPWFPLGVPPRGRPGSGRLQEIDLTEEYASKDGQGNLAKCRAAAWEIYGKLWETVGL